MGKLSRRRNDDRLHHVGADPRLIKKEVKLTYTGSYLDMTTSFSFLNSELYGAVSNEASGEIPEPRRDINAPFETGVSQKDASSSPRSHGKYRSQQTASEVSESELLLRNITAGFGSVGSKLGGVERRLAEAEAEIFELRRLRSEAQDPLELLKNWVFWIVISLAVVLSVCISRSSSSPHLSPQSPQGLTSSPIYYQGMTSSPHRMASLFRQDYAL